MAESIEMPVLAEKRRSIEEVFQSIVDRAGAKTVYGEPVTAGDRTIIPVASIRYGFGGGSGAKEKQQHGGGGGGGLTARPVGVIEATPERTRFIPIYSIWSIAVAVGLGLALGMALVPKRVDVRVDKRDRR
jgi:uncharacterized spore protein YtfJ